MAPHLYSGSAENKDICQGFLAPDIEIGYFYAMFL